VRDADDVANDGARRRRDDADPPRQEGQGTLARRIEETGGAKPLLQLLERQRQRARTGRLDVDDRHLELAARLIERQPAPAADGEAFFHRELQPLRLAREQHTVELRLRVLQREVQMPIARPLQTRHLALHPHLREPALQRQANSFEQLTDPIDPRLLRDRWSR